MNTLFVLLDGAEDHPIPQFQDRKPMEVAEMPFMDTVVEDRGSTQGSTYTHRFINQLFTGEVPRTPRGAIEALGLDLRMSPDRVAYRLSPAYIRNGTIDWAYHVDTEMEGRIIDCVDERMDSLGHMDPDILFFLKGRAVITLDCCEVIDMPCPPVPAPLRDRPEFMWDMIESIASELDGLTIMPWGGGRRIVEAPLFPRLGPLTVVSNSPTALGISRALGQNARKVDSLEDRFPLARELLEQGNVFLHADEIDEVSHQRDPELKVEILETVDGLMDSHFDDYPRIVYLVDHGTSSLTGEHLPVRVPVMSSYPCRMDDSMIPLSGLMSLLLR